MLALDILDLPAQWGSSGTKHIVVRDASAIIGLRVHSVDRCMIVPRGGATPAGGRGVMGWTADQSRRCALLIFGQVARAQEFSSTRLSRFRAAPWAGTGWWSNGV